MPSTLTGTVLNCGYLSKTRSIQSFTGFCNSWTLLWVALPFTNLVHPEEMLWRKSRVELPSLILEIAGQRRFLLRYKYSNSSSCPAVDVYARTAKHLTVWIYQVKHIKKKQWDLLAILYRPTRAAGLQYIKALLQLLLPRNRLNVTNGRLEMLCYISRTGSCRTTNV